MPNLNLLYHKIVENQIQLFSYPLSSCSSDAVTLCYQDKFAIFLDYQKYNSSQEEFSALAHEYGHCIVGATHHLHSPHQLVEQHENRANRAAVHEFLPFPSLLATVEKGYSEPWQIAEALDLPESFVVLAFNIYKAEGKLL